MIRLLIIQNWWSVIQRPYILLLIVFILSALHPQNSTAQLRNRLGIHGGFASFPTWTSGGIEDMLTPPHGEYGIHGGLSYIIAIDKKKDVVISGGIAYHKLHYHPVDITLRFHYPFAYLNTVYNKHFTFKYKGNQESAKYFFGLGINRAHIFGPGVYSAGYDFNTKVFTKLPVEPELIAGLGLIFKRGMNLIHFNLGYRYTPLKNYNFQIAQVGRPGLSAVFNYEYLMPELIVFPDFKSLKKRRGGSKGPAVRWNFY
jgi:hypothetical protein